ncbi:hypothetical protein DIZ27_39615 [Streptomyces sp. NWU339]|nr:hypothetical protein DIZ27_39615 [Streptomyces sp. NWU339]
MTFGTLLSSQGTDASFVLTPAGFPPGASLRSCVSDSIRLFRADSRSAGRTVGFRAFARRPFDIHYVSRFPRSIHNRASGCEIQACEHDEFDPDEGRS